MTTAAETFVDTNLFELLASVPCVGKVVHDANIVATMRAHAIRRLATLNSGDFKRFDAWVEIVSLEPATRE